MTQASTQPAALSAEQQIALALIAEMQNGANEAVEHRFNDGRNIFVVKVVRTPINLDEQKGMYVSLGPPGKTCKCCNGSGKRP
jgi:hypothetical protein